MQCSYCGEAAQGRYCSRLCGLLAAQDTLAFSRRRNELLRVPGIEFPNWIREMRSYLLAAQAMTHRVEPCGGEFSKKPRRVR